MAGSPGTAPPYPSRDQFRKDPLGWRSSHPDHLGSKKLIFALLAMLFLVLALGLEAYAFCRLVSSWRLLLATWKAWFGLALAIVGPTCAFLLICTLCFRLAELRYKLKTKEGGAAERLTMEWWWGLVPVLFGTACYFVATASSLPLTLSLLAWFLAIGPLVCLLSFLSSLAARLSGRLAPALIVGRLLGLLGVVAASLYLSALVLSFGLGVGHFILAAAAVGLADGLGILLSYLAFEQSAAQADKATEKKEDDLRAPTEQGWPKWLDEVRRTPPPGLALADPQANGQAPQSIEPAASLWHMLLGAVPTDSQKRALGQFASTYEKLVEKWGEGLEPNVASTQAGLASVQRQPEPSADLLLEGQVGSGRTAVLIACAFYAVLARGQRVLLLVPDGLRGEAIARRIGIVSRRLLLHHYVSATALRPGDLDKWLAGTDTMPQIVIGTLAEVEGHLFSRKLGDEQQEQCLRRLALLLEVVLIDDFMLFDDVQRANLPFFLAKQRLLLASEYVPLQVVAAFPPLAKAARDYVGDRLFGETRFVASRDIVSLRAPACRYWLMDTEVPAGPNADLRQNSQVFRDLAKRCLQMGLNVVVYRPGMSEDGRKALQTELEGASPEAKVRVLVDPDQFLDFYEKEQSRAGVPAGSQGPPGAGNATGLDQANVDVIVCEDDDQQRTGVALRLHWAHDQTVVFALRPAGVKKEQQEYGIFPVLADASAKPLALRHALSAVRFLRPRVPVAEWGGLVPGLDLLQRRAARKETEEDKKLLQSKAAGEAEPERLARLRIDRDPEDQTWPLAAFWDEGQALATVGAVQPHEIDERVCILPGTERWAADLTRTADQSLHEMVRNRRLKWNLRDGNELLRQDLAYVREFRVTHGIETFEASSLDSSTEGGLTTVAGPWRGGAQSPYLPAYRLRWELPADLDMQGPTGAPQDGVQWLHLGRPESHAGGLYAIRCELIGRFTEHGAPNPEPAPYGYSFLAHCGVLLLHPSSTEGQAVKAALRRYLAGAWRVGKSEGPGALGERGAAFWPALTAALTHAAETRAPGMTFFGRFLVFGWPGRPTESRCAQALAFLIAPSACGDSAYAALGQLLGNTDERAAFFEAVRWALEEIRKSPTQQFLRRLSRIGYEGDDNTAAIQREVEQALELVNAIILWAKEAQNAPRPLPTQPPDPADPRRIAPVIDWEPEPTATVVPWAECVSQLWDSARQRLRTSLTAERRPLTPDLDAQDLSRWGHAVRLRISMEGGPEPVWERLLAGAGDVMGLAAERLDRQLVLAPALKEGAPNTGADLRAALARYLETVLGAQPLTPATVVALHLWVCPAEEVLRGPSLSHPVNAKLRGGFAGTGLVLKEVVRPPQPLPAPPPTPVLPPQPGDESFRLPGEPRYEHPEKAKAVEARWGETLPPPPALGQGQERKWVFEKSSRNCELRWGFRTDLESRRYLDGILARLRGRISTEGYLSYILNDPYLESVAALGRDLESQHAQRDSSLPEFLLDFVQVFPYKEDPVGDTDWPRFPSEFLAYDGGDCEDSSILLVALLLHAGCEAAFLSMPGHLAVGIPGPYRGTYYVQEGKRYYYAETATQGDLRVALGSGHAEGSRAHVLPVPALALPGQAPAQILSARFEASAGKALDVTFVSRQSPRPLRIAAYVRATESVLDFGAAAVCLGAVDVPAPPEAGKVGQATLELDTSRIQTGANVLDVVLWDQGQLAGRWFGAASFRWWTL